MKKLFLLVALAILGEFGLNAQCAGAGAGVGKEESSHCPNSADWPSPITVAVSSGYRQDKLRWSISGEDNDPNILSELKWKNLQIMQIGAYGSYTSCRNYVVRASGDYGYIYHGDHTDTDYFESGREFPFSKSTGKAGKGSVYDLDGGVGYRVTSSCKRFVATPLVGYSFHGQNLHMYDGESEFFIIPTSTGNITLPESPIPGLDSSYRTRWYGPWLGIDFSAKVEQCAYVFGGFEWHFVNFRADGHWNLRKDLGPFYHRANGFGYVATLGANWEIWDHWSIGVVSNYRNFRSRSGHEHGTIKVPGALKPLEFEAKFNGVRWYSWSASAVVAYRF